MFCKKESGVESWGRSKTPESYFPIPNSSFVKLHLMTRLELIQADITKVEVDAIVNAANSSLLGGGGVDGAIHRVGGPEILEESKKIRAKQGGCKTGEAVITTAGKLPAKYVIHTVGPVWQGGRTNETELLARCYRNSLELALQHNVKTIAFPSISTGIYGYPIEEASRVALTEVSSFVERNGGLERVIFVCFSHSDLQIYQQTYQSLGLKS
jgi:O-acetyl-ADP-ribose deacetylase